MSRITSYATTERPRPKSWSESFVKRKQRQEEPAKNNVALLANGQPAYTRDRRIWQADIDRYGSAEKARQAKMEQSCAN